jgi:hypothetical protein
MQYQNLDRADVESVMNDLLNKNGQTTSLEVKEELRNRGFWATQAVVGTTLQEIAEDNDVPFDFNGVYRTYYQPGTQMSPTPATAPATSVAPAAPPVRQPVNPQDRDPLATAEVGAWQCTTADGSNPLYFKSTLSAEQARYSYHLVTGEAYVNVRSKRV